MGCSLLIVDDTPRAGNFEPLAHLPKHKSVVLGLISSKVPDLEDSEQITGRVNEAAQILNDPEKKRICLSPQCGFASHIEGNKVTEQDVEKKLKLVQDIAHQIWSDA
jgi:methionine synthase II (cobalamin-independent)